MEIKQYTGLWWLPTNPENKIYGSVRYGSGEYPILSLDGAFIKQWGEREFYDIILGLAENKKITLVGCVMLNFCFTQSGLGDYSRSEFKALLLCLGNHFAKKDDLQFGFVDVQFSHLKEWLGVSVFSAPNIKDTKNEFTVTLKKPLEKEIRLNELTLDIKGTWKYNGGNHFGSLNTDAKISIYCQKTGLQKIFKIIYAIRNFLRLTTGENIAVLSIIADELGTQIEIFVPNLIEEKKSQYRFSFCPVPIEFDQISEGLEVYLQNWFLFIEKFEPVYQLFFGVMDKKLYAVSEFLSLSQAIEAYHSRKYNNRLFPDEFIKIIDNFTQFSKMVTENLPDDPAKSAFRDKIKFINRKSLRMRTRELFSENIDVFKIFIEDETTFISKFVEARNFYTHYDPKMKAPIEQAELLSLTEELRLIIITLLLKEIEFKELDIKKIVSSYCRYKIKKLYSLF